MIRENNKMNDEGNGAKCQENGGSSDQKKESHSPHGAGGLGCDPSVMEMITHKLHNIIFRSLPTLHFHDETHENAIIMNHDISAGCCLYWTVSERKLKSPLSEF